ncbi:PEP-CTERM sorting domain-containing protein [Oceaniferula marina]|uniref:PEP-CTERM sorting domain-containing protein n=1 Tax=Oceaniferula marina TaxID=2748318 RepID=UPI001D0570A8|nr:PEP-CTERM sorting domain-containing protein [Oceaniferula marina]
MKHKHIGLSALLGATAFVGSVHGANVIVNPGFDNDSGTPIGAGGGGDRTITGWGSMHLYSQTYSGTQGPLLYEATSDTAADTYKGLRAPSQTVDLSTSLSGADLANIANGNGTFTFGSWMAGYSGDGNIVATQLQFFSSTDGSGAALSTFTLDRGVTTNQINTADKIVNPGGGNNATSETDPDWWAQYELSNTVPASAQSLTVTFVAGTGHAAGGANDWYADDVIVDITTVPEPSSAALVGLGGLALILRRRK